MNDKAKPVVIAVFGTTIARAERSYEVLRERLRRRFPDRPVMTGYLSARVRRKLAAAGRPVPGVDEALALAGDLGDPEVLAFLMADGEEFARLKKVVGDFIGASGRRARLTAPPLAQTETRRRFAAALREVLPPERRPGEALLLMGHGHRDGRSDEQYRLLEQELAASDPAIRIACVEGGLTLERALECFRAAGTRRVFLQPLLLAAGDHLLNDLAGDALDSWRSRLAAAGIEAPVVMAGLGEFPAIADFFVEQLQ